MAQLVSIDGRGNSIQQGANRGEAASVEKAGERAVPPRTTTQEARVRTLHFVIPDERARKRMLRRMRDGLLARTEEMFIRGVRRCSDVLRCERGAVTAEYAIVIMAAVAFAGVLLFVVRSPEIRQTITQLVQNALSTP